MTRYPRMLRRALLCAGFAASLAACVSCAPVDVTGFGWKDGSGRPVAFRQSGGFAGGREGELAPGKSTGSNRYIPRTPPAIEPGQALEIRVSSGSEGGFLGVSLRLDGKGNDAETECVFSPAKGVSSLWIEPDGPGTVRELAISILDGAGKPAAAGPSVSVLGVRIAPAFRGFSRDPKGGLSLSSGFRSEGAGRYSILRPFRGFTGASGEAGGGEALGEGSGGAANGAGGKGSGGAVPALVVRYSGTSEGDMAITTPDGVKLLVKPGSPLGSVVLPAALFGADPGAIHAAFPAGVDPADFHTAMIPAAEAELADLGRVVLTPRPAGDPEFDLYRWDLLPDVLVFDFRDYSVQDAWLKRLAFFVEKEGFRGKLAADAQIRGLHGWNAHDYRPEDLAEFFELARGSGFPLNASELLLRDILVERGVLVLRGGSYKPGKGAVISISRESEDYLRRTFVTHEAMHALYFADPDFRALAASMWAGMDRGEKWFWILYFGWMNYDVTSPYLMAAEVQAYLLQQPVRMAREYFSRTLPARLLEHHPELEKPIAEYMAKHGDTFTLKAGILDSWVRNKYGFGAGRAFFVR